MTTKVRIEHLGPVKDDVQVLQADEHGVPVQGVPPFTLQSGKSVELHVYKNHQLVVREVSTV